MLFLCQINEPPCTRVPSQKLQILPVKELLLLADCLKAGQVWKAQRHFASWMRRHSSTGSALVGHATVRGQGLFWKQSIVALANCVPLDWPTKLTQSGPKPLRVCKQDNSSQANAIFVLRSGISNTKTQVTTRP